jgi:hypothetical protein
MTANEKQKMADSIIKAYEDIGGSISRQQAEKIVDDFEKARQKYGDSVKYYDGISVGFGKLVSDTSELRKINNDSQTH